MPDNEIGVGGAKVISQALKMNTALNSLNLSGQDKEIMKNEKNGHCY